MTDAEVAALARKRFGKKAPSADEIISDHVDLDNRKPSTLAERDRYFRILRMAKREGEET